MAPPWAIQAEPVEAVSSENSHGDQVSDYAITIGYTTSVAVELQALRDGINLYIELSLTNVLIELDATIVVDMLKKNKGNLNSNDVILADCKEGLQKSPRV